MMSFICSCKYKKYEQDAYKITIIPKMKNILEGVSVVYWYSIQ
jgi:hypothetical protein